MDIRVSGHQVDTGDALKQHVWTRLEAMAEKYFSRALSAQVTFRPAPHGAFHCDIVCHVMTGLILKGAGEAQEAHPAFDQAAERIEKQLRRYLRRLKDRMHIVHLKDLAMRGGEQLFAEVGEGNLEWPQILEACQEADIEWYLVEQDTCQGDPFESLGISLRNLNRLGLK